MQNQCIIIKAESCESKIQWNTTRRELVTEAILIREKEDKDQEEIEPEEIKHRNRKTTKKECKYKNNRDMKESQKN